ncbi:hypothetical protein MGYG_04544 [Nannizzia gypsea CBS 118893]|uniref:PSI domain-containing protein n=1 Tax=Arthroderma gypseum (strain ATCC MYA-4604 / CBS 118893) TaxID=535722 RepID=E4UTP9_ARTGP|nr:hypothetical protein MGYG_04544 [Nannizzia gypsea CBS 118893]EFR01542.1 hypothetical protein MGYG_04544 [Nannizzia gypsea CBS 118893]
MAAANGIAVAIERFYEARKPDDLLPFCWRNQDCGSCLRAANFCSWCASSSTCVPNTSAFPLLAPLTNSSICPLGAKERWEIRTRPFGCAVSAASFLTCIVSVICTLVLVAAAYLAYQMWMAKKAEEEQQQQQDGGDGQLGGDAYGAGGGYGGTQFGGDGGAEGIGEVLPGIVGWMGQGQEHRAPETIPEEDEEQEHDERSPLL